MVMLKVVSNAGNTVDVGVADGTGFVSNAVIFLWKMLPS